MIVIVFLGSMTVYMVSVFEEYVGGSITYERKWREEAVEICMNKVKITIGTLRGWGRPSPAPNISLQAL